jgi:hypothetical protein
LREHGSDKKAGNGGGSGKSECAFVEEEASVERHGSSCAL